MIFIAPLVEGVGETLSVERLLWRMMRATAPSQRLRVNPPIRVKSGSFLNDETERRRHVLLAAGKARPHSGTILVLLDCEDDCPAQLGPRLLRDVQADAGEIPCIVVLAHREYETWFLAAAESLRAMDGLIDTTRAPDDPENIRDAKGWLGRHMARRYDPIAHQLLFTNRFDLQAARRVASFDRFCRKVAALCGSA